MGYYPSNPYITPVTSWGVSVIVPCWGLGEFQPPLTSQVSLIEATPIKIGRFHLFGADLTFL